MTKDEAQRRTWTFYEAVKFAFNCQRAKTMKYVVVGVLSTVTLVISVMAGITASIFSN
jgi:hypothetical protein